MNIEELKEQAEHAHESGEKLIGLTMAIVAVLLAIATLLSHRTHTEEVVVKGDANDAWNYYQAKNLRVHLYGALAEIADLQPNGKELAEKFKKKAEVEKDGEPAHDNKQAKEGAEKLQEKAREKDSETQALGQKAKFFDGAELCLEISIVLCSIALLAESKLYWQLSFISTAGGIAAALWGLLLR